MDDVVFAGLHADLDGEVPELAVVGPGVLPVFEGDAGGAIDMVNDPPVDAVLPGFDFQATL